MLNRSDIADIIWEHLGGKAPKGGAVSSVPAASRELPKKVFISDWELRKRYKVGEKSIRLPANAILSPLSRDWLDYAGIEVLPERTE